MPIHILRHRKHPLAGFWVAPNGSDTNAGTFRSPFRTIQRAANVVAAGQNVWVRGGTYVEQIDISADGTAAAPIRFQSAPGERAIIDGEDTLASGFGVLLRLSGDYVQMRDLEVMRSAGMGVLVSGAHDVVSFCYSHHHEENGILLQGSDNIVEDSQVYRNVLVNEYGASWGSYSSGLSAARGSCARAIMRRNHVWENWGEGISTYEATDTLIEDNVAHDNATICYYLSDVTGVTLQRNFGYNDPASYVYEYGDNNGIILGDEVGTPVSSDLTIVNNIIYGCWNNFYFWSGLSHGLVNVTIAANALVNSIGDVATIRIADGPHSNVVIRDNIVQQDDALPVAYFNADADVVWSYNNWSKAAPAAVQGTGDVTGAPLLADVAAHPFVPESYQLTASSPARGVGVAEAAAVVDFWRTPRSNPPDMGAHEY
jgi:hypothetical protein